MVIINSQNLWLSIVAVFGLWYFINNIAVWLIFWLIWIQRILNRGLNHHLQRDLFCIIPLLLTYQIITLIKVRLKFFREGLPMKNSNYNAPLTFKLYILAALLFASYGGRVCPMLETLTIAEVFTHVTITFSLLFMVRHFLLANHLLNKEIKQAKLDTICFSIASIPLAIYYNISYG